jgi:LssY C-terminus
MGIEHIPIVRWLTVSYKPSADARGFLDRSQTQTQHDLEVTVAVLDASESRKVFGVPMARRGIQPVWLRIANRGQSAYRLNVLGIDPNYFSPHEAAGANHYKVGRRLLEFGFLAWIFFPLLLFLPSKLIGGWIANRKMDAFFQQSHFRMRPISPGGTSEGFVFTSLDVGSKIVHVNLIGHNDTQEFVFTISVPGLNADYLRHEIKDRFPKQELIDCDIPALRTKLANMPRATTNRHGTREGDPVNLVVAGEFLTVIGAFGARWDETETVTLHSSWKTFRAFIVGSEYRYSPVSPLYLFGRSHDFSLQRIRRSINERLHLRLWATPLRFHGVPVWVGQVSRDIGVRFTWRTWNLTTHRVDPDVDEARDYVVEDLLQAGRLEIAGYVDGVGECSSQSPRKNLTGDPYFTDGKRAAVLLSTERTTPQFVAWA